MDAEITRLDRLLSELQLLDGSSPEIGEQLFQEICGLVLENQLYVRIWCESTLNQLQRLFEIEKPDEELFRDDLEMISSRTKAVREINDFFFAVVDQYTPTEMLCEYLSRIQQLPEGFTQSLDATSRIQELRNGEGCAADKIEWFLGFLRDDLNLDITEKDSVKGVLSSLKSRNAVGKINALLVKSSGEAIAIALHIKLQSGTGQVFCLVKGSEEFREAVVRAQSAMREKGFLSGSEDIFYSLELTDTRYGGSSLALAAAVAMYDVRQNFATDPYTAFTGDINLTGQEWSIKPVQGVVQKVASAKLAGCRRVFVPNLNCAELAAITDIRICGVNSLTDTFIQLRPNRQLLPSCSLQGRKVAILQDYCRTHGWDLSTPIAIQAGVMFSIAPLSIPSLKVQIYESGAHTPKKNQPKEYNELLSLISSVDQAELAIRNVNQTFKIQSPTLQKQIENEIEKLGPTERRSEQYCSYSFKFVRGKESLTVKQYNKGTLTLQGSAGALYKSVLESIVPLYKIHNPNADISVENLLGAGATGSMTSKGQKRTMEVIDVPLPHIGTDESGKGDYFGPMVVAGVLIDKTSEKALKEIGVKDSKTLTDRRCKDLASKIRQLLPGRYYEVEILPDKYNQLYDQFKAEGKNLNHLLAWGHARAMENLLHREKCSHAIADQFGDENYIQSKLLENGKQLTLVQLPKGERFVAVAAASILARDRFLARIESLGKSYNVSLPKGASDLVVETGKQLLRTHGEISLKKVAKVHHRTTGKIKEVKDD